MKYGLEFDEFCFILCFLRFSHLITELTTTGIHGVRVVHIEFIKFSVLTTESALTQD